MRFNVHDRLECKADVDVALLDKGHD
jgi:hypothetical protein